VLVLYTCLGHICQLALIWEPDISGFVLVLGQDVPGTVSSFASGGLTSPKTLCL